MHLVNKTTQEICNSQNKNETNDNYIYHQTWLILTPTVFHSKHDVHRFIGEHTVFNYKNNLNDIKWERCAHAYIWQNIYTVKGSTNVTTIKSIT